jgi:hypothetical protein
MKNNNYDEKMANANKVVSVDRQKSYINENIRDEYEESKSLYSSAYSRHKMADEKLNFFFVPLAGCLLGTPSIIKNLVETSFPNQTCQCTVSILLFSYTISLTIAFILFIIGVSYKASLGRDSNCFLDSDVYSDEHFLLHSIERINECINAIDKQVEEKHKISKWVFIFTCIGCALFLILAIFPWIVR